MDWELWNIRHLHFFCIRMKTKQLFRFSDLLLLVFLSRMNIWLWRSVIRYTHAQGNFNEKKTQQSKAKQTQPTSNPPFSSISRRRFHVNKPFQCVYVCVRCVCARLSCFLSFPFFIFYTKKNLKNKKRQVFKRYESTILDDLTGRNYIKLIISWCL